MHENTRAELISPDGATELFDILTGVHQVHILEANRFVHVLDNALIMAINGKWEDAGLILKAERVDAQWTKVLDR